MLKRYGEKAIFHKMVGEPLLVKQKEKRRKNKKKKNEDDSSRFELKLSLRS